MALQQLSQTKKSKSGLFLNSSFPYWVLVIIPLIGFAALYYSTLIQIDSVSVYHDELWNYPAAVAMLRGDSWVLSQEVRLFNYPIAIVSGPYQGAIKSWLLVPILGIFGTSPLVLRGVNTVLGFIYLLSLFWVIRISVSKYAAWLIFLLPLIDPNFLLYVPTDQGPFLLQCIFITVAIGAWLKALSHLSWRWIALAVFMTSATLADKLTAIPFVAAFGIIIGLGLWQYRRSIPMTLPKLIILIIIAVIPLIPNVIYFATNGTNDLIAATAVDAAKVPPYLTRVLDNSEYFFTGFFNEPFLIHVFTGTAATYGNLLFPWVGLALLVATPLIIVSLRHHVSPPLRQIGIFYPLLFFGLLFIFSFFKGLNRPWHYFIFHPIFVLGALSFGIIVLNGVTKLIGKKLGLILSLLLITGMVVQGSIFSQELLTFLQKEKGINLTSLSLYEFEKTLKKNGAKKVICISYSLCNPIYVLSAGQIQIVDSTGDEFSEASLMRFGRWLQEPDTYLLYRHSVSTPGTPKNWLVWLNKGSDWLINQPALIKSQIMVSKIEDIYGTEFGIVTLQKK